MCRPECGIKVEYLRSVRILSLSPAPTQANVLQPLLYGKSEAFLRAFFDAVHGFVSMTNDVNFYIKR